MMRNNLLLAVLIRFTGVILSFLLNVYLSRSLEKSVLGDYFLYSQLLLVLSVFSRRGVDTALLKTAYGMSKSDVLSVSNRYIRNTINPILYISIIIVIVSYFFTSNDVFQAVLFVCISLLPLTIFNVIAECLKGLNKQISSTIIQTCLLPIFIFTVFFVLIEYIYTAYVIAIYIVMIVSILVMKKTLKLNNYSKNVIFNQTDFWEESRAFMIIGVLNVMMNSTDLLMLGLLTEAEQVASYGIANKLVALSSIILVAVNGVLGPKFSKLWKSEQYKKIYYLFIRATFIMSVLAIFMLLFIMLSGELMLTLIYGKEYLGSVPLLKILALGQSVLLATGPVAYLLMMTNEKKIHRKSLLIAVSANIFLNIILIPEFGAIGAAIATAISLVLKNMYSFIKLIYATGFRDMKHEK